MQFTQEEVMQAITQLSREAALEVENICLRNRLVSQPVEPDENEDADE